MTVTLRHGGLRLLPALAIGLSVLVAPMPTWSRPKQNPPSLALRKPPNVIVAATLVAADGHRLRLTIRDTLFGADAPPQLSVQVPDAALPELQIGRDYIVVFNDSRRDPMRPGRQMPQPGGPRLVYEPGAEPALFPDTFVFRELLGSDTACLLGLDQHGRRRLFAGLRGDDRQLQHFLAVDLYMCPVVRAELTHAERRSVVALANDVDAHPLARGWLLRLALEDDAVFAGRGRAAAAAVLEHMPVEVGDSHRAELVRMTLAALESTGATAPAAALARWLYSDSAALAELALLALRRQTPALERTALTEALASDRVPAATREFLHDHDRRLRLSGR